MLARATGIVSPFEVSDTLLTGKFVFDQRRANVKSVMLSIEDARQEALIREQGRKEAEERD